MVLNRESVIRPVNRTQEAAANNSFNPLHILVVNHEFPPIGGGASKVSFELAKKLVQRGYRVCVLTSWSRGLPNNEVVDGVEVHRVWSWRKNVHDGGLRGSVTFLMSALPRLRRRLNADPVDVVHYFFGLPTGVLSFYTHSVRRLPYIIGLRGSDVPFYDRKSRTLRVLHRILMPITRRIWRGASDVIAVSYGLRDLAQETTPDLSIGVIHNGIDVIEGAAEMRSRKRADRVRLVCVARLVPRKGVCLLLEALVSLDRDDIELVVAGTGPSHAELEAFSATHDIADRVKFAGYCRPDQLRDINVSSDIFVLPTLSDAFPNVVLEAMGAALPVIASRVGGIPEAVVDGETGILVKAGDRAQLANAISVLVDDRALREAYGLAGQQRAREMFTWHRNARLYLDSYERATAQLS